MNPVKNFFPWMTLIFETPFVHCCSVIRLCEASLRVPEWWHNRVSRKNSTQDQWSMCLCLEIKSWSHRLNYVVSGGDLQASLINHSFWMLDQLRVSERDNFPKISGLYRCIVKQNWYQVSFHNICITQLGNTYTTRVSQIGGNNATSLGMKSKVPGKILS